ncbi:MAG: preprotein translocase subunit YajC [Bacteroidetes bacterium]|nr:MAG: preprotein translocase subunit YajC [Bacteroidota bacterium]
MYSLFILLQAEGGEAATGFGFQQMIFFVAILGIFYFFMIRPQQKRAKEEKQFRESLEKGDKVMTIGGIYGNVEQIDEGSVIVRVDNNTKLRVDKTALRAVPEPGSDNK